MNKEELTCLIGKYLNGYKIVKVENDPFVKGQINLFTDEWKFEAFNDRSLVVFRVREEGNTSKYYQELVDKENYNYKQALNDISETINNEKWDWKMVEHILQIIDKALGGNNE